MVAFLKKYIYYMLLFTIGVIPLQQELTAFCVGITFLSGLYLRLKEGKQQQVVLKKREQYLLYLLLAIAIGSLYFSRDWFLSSFNLLYVGGQYVAIIFLLLNYGQGAGQKVPKEASLWQQLQAMPRPVQLVAVFLAMSIVVSCLGIGQKILGITAEGIWVDPDKFPELKIRVYSTLVNPNILGGYLVLIIAYAVGFVNVIKKRALKNSLIYLGLLACICLLYTYSRGNWLAAAAVLLAFCLCYCHKAFLPVAGVGLLGLALGGQAMLHRLSSITSKEDTSAALRVAYFRSTKWIIEEFPQGVGWYGYRFVYPEYNYYLADTSVIMYHCHNIFLNVLAELGWHGLIVFLLIWGAFLKAGYELAKEGKTPYLQGLGQAYVLASIGIAIGGLTDHVYFNTQMGLLFWTLGIITMLGRQMNNK